MKRIIALSLISSSLLFSNSLEDMLTDNSKKFLEEETKIKYYEIKQLKPIAKAKRDFKINKNSTNIGGEGEVSRILSNMDATINRYNVLYNDMAKSQLKSRNNEEIIIKNFEIPEVYKKRGLKEKVSVAFEIDKNKNISNIHFDEKSKHNEINNNLIEAIKKSALDIKSGEKDKINIHYKFNL